MYNMDSNAVSTVLNNPFIQTVLIALACYVTYKLGLAFMDFYKGFNNKDK